MGQSQQPPSGAAGALGGPSPKDAPPSPPPGAPSLGPAPPSPPPGAPSLGPAPPSPPPGAPSLGPAPPSPPPGAPSLGPAPPSPPPGAPSLGPAPPLPPPGAAAPPSLGPAPPLPPPGAAAPMAAAPPPPRGALLPAQRPPRLRRFHWLAIPAARVRGRRSVWTGSTGHDRVPLDVQRLELLFREPPGWGPRGQLLRGRPQGQVSLLDSKKMLNLEIFLKQFKRPVQQVVADLRDGAGALYGAEKLLELSKMLPDAEEVRKLTSFQGPWSRLSDAETFTLLLLGVPGYARRLELLVLEEEFFPQLGALKSSIQTLTEAALELLACEELHVILRLVLQAGNYMNSGGYAGCAAGFRLASLLRLADTKANQPGLDLLHFVAMEAERKDRNLLDFPSKLPHVGPASRIQEQEVASELQRLAQRLAGAHSSLPELGMGQLDSFLQRAEAELGAGQRALERLRQATATLRDFYCEDEARFCLQEACAVLHVFGGRFRTAVQENRAREEAARRRQQRAGEPRQRRSIASCCACELQPQDAELDFLFTCTPWPGRRSCAPRGPGPGSCAALDSGAGRCPVRAATPQPAARGGDAGWGSDGQRPLSRRHTLAVLPAPPEPQGSVDPAPAPPSPSPPPGPPVPPVGRKVGLASCLPAPGASPQAGGCSPDISPPLRFPSLFRKRGPPEGQAGPISPRASPKGVSTLRGFFRHLSLGEKPPRPSKC